MASELDDRRAALAESFDPSDVPRLEPGQQMVTIDERPRGAMRVDVKRDIGQVLVNIRKTAQAAGDNFFYRWPVKVKDKQSGEMRTEWVEGPSVKATNAVARLYGNCGVKMRAIDVGDSWMLYARFEDFETGFFLERPFQQRKGQNIGGSMDRARAADIVFQIGVSKATRNVIANALAEQVDYAFLEAREAIVGRIEKEPDKYRARLRQRIEELHVDVNRVERRIGRTIDKWLAPDMAMIIAEIQSVNDSMALPDEMWPAAPIQAPPRPTAEDVAQGTQDKQAAAAQDAKATGAGDAARDHREAKQETGAPVGMGAKPGPTPEQLAEKNATEAAKPSPQPDPLPAEQVEDEQDVVQDETPAFTAALEMITKMEEAAKADTALDLTELKKRGRSNIDSLEGLSDDEREMLRGRFTTFALELQRERAKKGKKK